MPRPKFAGVRSLTKKKKEEVNPDIMSIFGLKEKDYFGEPYFLPTDEGGIILNTKCKLTREDFERGLRNYISKK